MLRMSYPDADIKRLHRIHAGRWWSLQRTLRRLRRFSNSGNGRAPSQVDDLDEDGKGKSGFQINLNRKQTRIVTISYEKRTDCGCG